MQLWQPAPSLHQRRGCVKIHDVTSTKGPSQRAKVDPGLDGSGPRCIRAAVGNGSLLGINGHIDGASPNAVLLDHVVDVETDPTIRRVSVTFRLAIVRDIK